MKSDGYHGCRIAVIFFFLFAFLFNNYSVVGDGIYLYAKLESLILDRDLNLINQRDNYRNKNMGAEGAETIPYGTAIFNAPFYLLALGLEKIPIFQKKIGRSNPAILDITARTASINLASNFYTFITIVLSYKILTFLTLKVPAAFVIIALLISTPLLYYSVFVPSLDHAINTFLITFLVYLFLRLQDKRPIYQGLSLGALLGIDTTVRFFDVFFLPWLLLYFLWSRRWDIAKYILFGFWLVIITFMIIDKGILYGVIKEYIGWHSGHIVTTNPIYIYPKYMFHLLFHPTHGLFLWSPLTLVSLIGLGYLYIYKEGPQLAVFLIGLFFVLAFSYSSISTWHGGWSFSARYLTSLFPIFLVGYAFFLKYHKRIGTTLGIIFTAYSFFLMLNHYLGVIHGETGTPFDMVRIWISGEISWWDFLTKLYRYSIINNLFQLM